MAHLAPRPPAHVRAYVIGSATPQSEAEVTDPDRITQAYQRTHVITLRLGIVLIGLFAFELVEMAIAVAHHQSASTDFGPLIAGIVLIRGGLRPVRTIRFLAGMAMTSGLIDTIARLWVPVQLIISELHVHDFGRILNFGIGCVYVLVALAVYRGASDESVEIALRAEFGKPGWASNPVLGPVAGLLVSIVFVVILAPYRPNFDIALAAVRAKYGDSYQYQVTSWNVVNQDEKVDIEAYNSDMVKKLEVEIVSGHVVNITNEP